MAQAIVIAAWKDDTNAYAAVSVAEGGKIGNVEYRASTPLADAQGNAFTLAQLKANLIAALQAVRNAQIVPAPTALGISGTVTL